MKSPSFLRAARLWGSGALLFVLRLLQNRTGFEPDTGLALPSLAGTTLIVCLAAAALLELLLARRQSGERVSFAAHFSAPGQGLLTALVVGALLLAAGGVLLILNAGFQKIAALVTGALAAASAVGFLVLTRQLRAGQAGSVAPVLPAMFFGVFLVLTVYLPTAADPVLARYFLQVLAAAMAAYAFSQLAGFLRRESRPRTFTPVAGLAVMLCLAAMADGGQALVLLYGGCALLLTVFLLLQKTGETAAPSSPEASAGAGPASL